MKKPKLKIRLMNSFLKLCQKYNLTRRHFKAPSYSKILIISTTGVGDTMWGTPALKMMRQKYPKAHITVLTSPLSAAVLRHNPHIDEMITFKSRGGQDYFFKFLSFYRKRFDTIILFHCSYKWATPFAYFLGPQRLIAFKHDAKDFDFLLTHLLHAELNHPLIQRLMLIKCIGVMEEDFVMKMYLQKKEHQQALDFLKECKIDLKKPIIGLQPGASDAFKRWPLENFVELAEKLSALGFQMVVFGDAKERDMAAKIAEKANVHISSGQLSLRVSAALLSRMSVLVTNDTGPLHLAISMKVPLVTMFGPTPAHLCWPHLENPIVRILFKPSPCEKCVYRACLKPYCMELIQTEEVLNHVLDLISSAQLKISQVLDKKSAEKTAQN